jgi:hypothetical protein
VSPLRRRFGAAFVALAFALAWVPPAAARAAGADDQTQANELIQHGCSAQPAPSASPLAVAQVTGTPEPVGPAPESSASPTPAPYVGVPRAPGGPQELVPAPATPAPGSATPPPLISPTPLPNGSGPPVFIYTQTAPPSSTPIPNVTPSSGPIVPPVASPSPSPPPGAEELPPNTYAILGDKLSGTNKPGEPFDLDGHVNIFYADGVLGGDHAHYDGQRYIDITGHTFVRNRAGDTTLYADAVRFDTSTQKATLIHGRGESTNGVEHGKIHFAGSQMVTDRDGVTHIDHSFLTTCENPRAGYHIESKTLDIYPGDKAVGRANVVYLGALAVLYLPILVISLAEQQQGTRKQPGFLPLVGYDAVEGFYIKARIGFSPSDYYYGYYRIEEYTRIGLGLGYVGTIRRKDGRRQTDINFFTQKNKQDGSQSSNFQLTDQEAFSRTTRGQFGINYTGDYGPLVNLPPQYDITAAVDHGTPKGDTQNYSFQRQTSGTESSTNDYGFTDHHVFSQNFTNDTTISYTTSESQGFGTQDTLHFETLTHYSSSSYDYDLTYDHYDANSTSYNVEKEPELEIRPHNPLFPHETLVPITAQYLIGIYEDPTVPLQTSRGQVQLQLGPALAHFLDSDFSAQVTVQQDAYGTGDLKANITQQATLTTPIWGHILNTISYDETHANGPLAEPFKVLDVLGDATKQANDVLRLYNDDIYSVSLTATTFFNREAQAVGYEVTLRPSPRSTLELGGDFTPGPGSGFDRTNVQIATPFGYASDLQFAAYIDWKNHGRLEDKNIYYRHVIGDCYEIRIAYNEDTKQVTATVDLLAFPSAQANFGIGQSSLSSIIPQSFSTTSFTTGGQ